MEEFVKKKVRVVRCLNVGVVTHKEVMEYKKKNGLKSTDAVVRDLLIKAGG